MGKQYDQITEKHAQFIIHQQLFFVATSTSEGRINLSPKGHDSLRIVNPNQVVWLNLTGSGNETGAHLMQDNRMTLMFCAFEGDPKVLRLYGQATGHHEGSDEWEAHIGRFPLLPGARQIIVMEVESVVSSCGFGIPLYDYVEQREELPAWAEKKGVKGIRDYWRNRNNRTIDGKPTDFD
ncbi:MAG: pyridoxamine 5'-phosphate oxidase family protein [Candidatus Thiodiazotropha sp. (ex Myrtea spinifera)]|nr:pyridoxamine 5'-phosphate oxidase family protein [Candidatus Thiodiazotropha sp. (ex Myrtea spinifera)]